MGEITLEPSTIPKWIGRNSCMVMPEFGLSFVDHRKLSSRKIEQQLSAELHAANALVISATTPAEKREGMAAYDRALQRFADFVARGIVPEDLMPSQ